MDQRPLSELDIGDTIQSFCGVFVWIPGQHRNRGRVLQWMRSAVDDWCEMRGMRTKLVWMRTTCCEDAASPDTAEHCRCDPERPDPATAWNNECPENADGARLFTKVWWE